MLDTSIIQIIKATVPALKEHADTITSHFYPLLFAQYPEVIPYFNQTHQGKGSQPKALARAVVAYGANIDELGNLNEAVTTIVQKHASLGIQPKQYDFVGDCLLQAIKVVLGDAATAEVLDAWGAAYHQLAQILIEAEEAVYATNEDKSGGWRGEREFIVCKKMSESSVITSFYFEPSDGKPVSDFDAGQFTTLIMTLPDGQQIRRNYSLSDAPGKNYLRISVKREPSGVMSNYLHDHIHEGATVNLLPPCGNFTLKKNDKPLVLLTGGVGITPAISMLNTEINSGREIRFIHAAINSGTHAFKNHVDQLAAKHSHLSPYYLYSDPEVSCSPHTKGLITRELIEAQLPQDRDVEFYFLGPKPFMKAALGIAKELCIPENQIHFEFFGPTENLA